MIGAESKGKHSRQFGNDTPRTHPAGNGCILHARYKPGVQVTVSELVTCLALKKTGYNSKIGQ